MKHKKYIIMPMMLVLLSVATSCEQEDMPPSVTADDIVEITATIGSPATRVQEFADNQYGFEKDDRIHIVGWYGDYSDRPNPAKNAADSWWNDAESTYNGSKWKTVPYMRWQNGVMRKHHFLAWWPDDFARSNDDLTAIHYDAAGKSAVDLLVAEWSSDMRPHDNTVILAFAHAFARFDLQLTFKNQYTNIANIKATITAATEANIDITTRPIGFDLTNSTTDVPLLGRGTIDSNNVWKGYGLFIPQSMDACKITLTFTADDEDKTIEYTHGSTVELKSCTRTTLNLTVGNDKLEVAGVSVTDWNTAPDIDGGEAEEVL